MVETLTEHSLISKISEKKCIFFFCNVRSYEICLPPCFLCHLSLCPHFGDGGGGDSISTNEPLHRSRERERERVRVREGKGERGRE